MFQFPDHMLQVFKDEEVQSSFEKNGYVILPYYDADEIAYLTGLYDKLHPANETGFFPSTFSSDKDFRVKGDEEIRRINQKYISKYCENVRVVNGAFIVKYPGKASGMCVHQDMSLVDESRYTGINIWAPLIDLTVKNGALFVLPGSHRIFPTYRGSSIPEFFSPVMEEMIDYLVPVKIQAGQAVFFDQSIVHFSPPNYSKTKRIVTNTYFTHQDAEFRTYYWDGKTEGKVEAFEQDKDFMLNFEQFKQNIKDRPQIGQSLGLVDYPFPQIDSRFLETHFSKTNARVLIQNAIPKQEESKEKDNWLSKLKKVFAS